MINARDLKADLPSWVILDARPVRAWEKGHIPGSVSFSWETYTRTDASGVSYRIMNTTELAATLGSLGITRKTPVVVYGDAKTSWGGEGWVCWMLAWLGHCGPVRLVAGGIRAWEANGFELETGLSFKAGSGRTVSHVVYIPEPRDDLSISAQELHQRADHVQLVDTRSTREWIFGRLAGAVHIPWKDFFNHRSRTPLDSHQTRQLLKNHDIRMDKPIVYYCTGGIRSAYAWMVHELSGLPTAINFEGGTKEWDKVYP